MVKVIVIGTIEFIGPEVTKDGGTYRRIHVRKNGYTHKTGDRIVCDQVYEITAANCRMALLEGISPGDRVETTSFLNSIERSDGSTTWHSLNLNLRKISKLI